MSTKRLYVTLGSGSRKAGIFGSAGEQAAAGALARLDSYWEPPHPVFGLQFRASLQQVGEIVVAAAAGLSTVANLTAPCWFGMCRGVTSRSANQATLKTILFVQVIPWFVTAFGTNMVTGLVVSGLAFRGGPTQGASFFAWMPVLSALLDAGVAVAKDVGFIVWSRNKLHSSLREQAACSLGERHFAAPRLVPETVSAPPGITA